MHLYTERERERICISVNDIIYQGECCGLLVGQSRIVRARFLDELQRNLIILTENLERQNLIAAEFGLSNKKK